MDNPDENYYDTRTNRNNNNPYQGVAIATIGIVVIIVLLILLYFWFGRSNGPIVQRPTTVQPAQTNNNNSVLFNPNQWTNATKGPRLFNKNLLTAQPTNNNNNTSQSVQQTQVQTGPVQQLQQPAQLLIQTEEDDKFYTKPTRHHSTSSSNSLSSEDETSSGNEDTRLQVIVRFYASNKASKQCRVFEKALRDVAPKVRTNEFADVIFKKIVCDSNNRKERQRGEKALISGAPVQSCPTASIAVKGHREQLLANELVSVDKLEQRIREYIELKRGEFRGKA